MRNARAEVSSSKPRSAVSADAHTEAFCGPSGVLPASIHALDADPCRVRVQLDAFDAFDAPAALARLAVAPPYVPAVGDRVLVTGSGEALYVIGILYAPRAAPPVIALADGATITVAGAAAEMRDPSGRLLVRYEGGALHLSSSGGDMVLAAPSGRVRVQATDIELDAGRDIVQRAGRGLAVEAPRVDVEAEEGHVTVGQASIAAERIVTTASVLAQQVERFELTATRLVERTRDTYRDASDLCQTSAGRMRSLVKGAYALYARRAAIASEEETKIDGSKVLLG